jgi:hypothetical protein
MKNFRFSIKNKISSIIFLNNNYLGKNNEKLITKNSTKS